MDIRALLNRWEKLTLEDEDGDPLEVEWNGSLSPEQLEAWEEELGVALPAGYREFMLLTDGGFFFGLEIESRDSAWLHEEQRLLTCHNWGNGDFDCLVLDDAAGGKPGSVVFMNHSPEVTVPIADSFGEWLQRAYDEISRTSALRHPGDYRQGAPAGMYAHVLGALRGVDCELNS